MHVAFSSRALRQLEALYDYIAADAGSRRARDFVMSIIDYCESFSTFPHRGAKRDDIRPGLRVIGFRRRVSIAFTVKENAVPILGVFYGGQDHATALRSR